MATAFGYDEVFLQHRTGHHPERPARLTAIVEHLRHIGLMEQLIPVPPRPDPMPWIRQLHDEAYLERLKSACEEGLPFIDHPDSAICPDSYGVAMEAVATVLGACDLIAGGEVANAFCAVRPPGHHVQADRSLGFCLFANAAIAARYLQQDKGFGKILILDWDVHHGNGTQSFFERDDTVFYASLHQHPATCFPGTGWPNEFGEGIGRGFTLNLPLAPGDGDDEILDLFSTNFLTVANDFAPDFIIISAGFDGHRKDPLAQLECTEFAYAEMMRKTHELAEKHCGGRILSLLEGGYQLGTLASCVSEHVKILVDSARQTA